MGLLKLIHPVNSVPSFTDDCQASNEFSLWNSRNDIFDDSAHLIHRQKVSPQKNNPTLTAHRIAQDIAEISITGDQHSGFFFDDLEDFLVRSKRIHVSNIPDVVAGSHEHMSDRPRTVSVNEEFHVSGSSRTSDFVFVGEKSGIENTGANLILCNRGIFLLDLLKSHPTRQRFKDNMDRGSGALDAWFAVLDIRPNNNMSLNASYIDHTFMSSSNLGYYIVAEKSKEGG